MNAILLQENIDILNVVILGIISLVLLMLSAMASGSEVAFFSLKRADIADLESRSDASSRRVIDLLDNPDRLLATILVTNNMINICLVIVTTQIIDALFIFSGVWDFVFKIFSALSFLGSADAVNETNIMAVSAKAKNLFITKIK